MNDKFSKTLFSYYEAVIDERHKDANELLMDIYTSSMRSVLEELYSIQDMCSTCPAPKIKAQVFVSIGKAHNALTIFHLGDDVLVAKIAELKRQKDLERNQEAQER